MPAEVVSLDRARELAFVEEQLEEAVGNLSESSSYTDDPQLWAAVNALYAAGVRAARAEGVVRLDHPDTYLRECDSCGGDVDELDVKDGPDGIELCAACCLCIGCGERLADERLTADEGEAYCVECAGALVNFARRAVA